MKNADRIYGRHEAAAMFEAIQNALALLERGGSTASQFLHELQAERELLLRELERVRAALS